MPPSTTSRVSVNLEDITEKIDAFRKQDVKNREELSLCEQCNKNTQLSGWAYCLECSIKMLPHLAKGERVFNSCALIAQHMGDYDHNSFGSAELDFTNFKQVFVKKNFRNCDFTDVKFSNVDFRECTFKHVNLTSATFLKANFSKCEFEYVDFTGAIFEDSIFRKSSFQNCTIRYSEFKKCNFEKSILSKLKLLKSIFISRTILSGCLFYNTELSYTFFDNCLLHNAVFIGDEIVDIGFSDCDLSNSDMTCANINKIDIFANCNVKNLHLTYDQQEEILMANKANWEKVKLVLIPTPAYARRSQLTFGQHLLMRDICLGISDTVCVAFNCIAIGSFCGLLYCIISGSFGEDKLLLRPFFWATTICSALLLVPCLWASMHPTQNVPAKINKILDIK